MQSIKVNLGQKTYKIIIGAGSLRLLPRELKRLKLGTSAVIITNPLIKKIAAKKIENTLKKAGIIYCFETIPDSEKSKSQNSAFKLLGRISRFARQKKIFIIALGGGVVGDLAGFVASVFKRGVPYIQIPTTLLAQVDSSIGGKVGIDLAYGKNLIGAFYQPRLVISDLTFLNTLPKKEIRNGLAEAVKYGLIKDKALFEFIEHNYQKILGLKKECLEYIVARCVSIKADIVSRDEYESKGIRTSLNFGHTIGHAIEAAGRFTAYTHGEAVAMGMLAAAKISFGLGILEEKNVLVRIKKLAENTGLPIKVKGLRVRDIMAALKFDKKFIHNKNRFVLLDKIGKARVKENIPWEIIRKEIEALVI